MGRVMLSKAQEIMQTDQLSTIVQQRFSFFVNFLLRTSSIESLVGSTQKGVAKMTTSIMPKSAIKMATGMSL